MSNPKPSVQINPNPGTINTQIKDISNRQIPKEISNPKVPQKFFRPKFCLEI